FKTGVATTPARLASGWLARLYREGVEPSGSLQKVSDRSIILLFWIYPGAREVSRRCLSGLRNVARAIERGHAMRTAGEIKRLSEMPAESIAAATTKIGPRHVPAGSSAVRQSL